MARANGARDAGRELSVVRETPDQDQPPARAGSERAASVPGGVDEERISELRQAQVSLIGKRIQDLRRKRFTLSQLAEVSGVSVGLLSRLENGIGNPSFASLNAIARALEVDAYTFFDPPQPAASLLPRGKRSVIRLAGSSMELELLSPTLSAPPGLVATLIRLPRNQMDDIWIEANGSPREQLDLVMDGSVRVQIDQEMYELGEGDAIIYDGSRRHRRTNTSRTETAVLFSVSRQIDIP